MNILKTMVFLKNFMITNLKLINSNEIYNFIKYDEKSDEYIFNDGTWNYYLNEYSKWRVEEISRDNGKTWIKPKWNNFNPKDKIN